MPAALAHRHKLAFFSVPKSASTSMKMVLYELENGRPWSGEPDRVHPQFPTFPIREADFAAAEGYWWFTIVRDPVARLLASWGNRVHHHRDIEKDVGRRLGKRLRFRFRTPKLSLRPGPEDYFRHLAEYRAASYSIWHHTEPISTFIGSDLSRFDAIYRIEDLAELEEDLSRRTGKRISMPREQTAGRKVALDELSGAAREAVLAHTRADYDLLRDFYAPPG